MQTLGLARDTEPTDGLLKRLFWPTINNTADVELVRRQGFWLCLVVAVSSCLMLAFTGPKWFAFLVGAVYFLAALGVRQGSIGAAVVIFLCYLCDRVAAVESFLIGLGASSPVVGLFILALLLSNIRATLLARSWQKQSPDTHGSDEPEFISPSFLDKLRDRLPPAFWPRGQYVFFPLAGALLLLSIIGMVMLPRIRHRQLERQRRMLLQQQQEGTQQIKVRALPLE